MDFIPRLLEEVDATECDPRLPENIESAHADGRDGFGSGSRKKSRAKNLRRLSAVDGSVGNMEEVVFGGGGYGSGARCSG